MINIQVLGIYDVGGMRLLFPVLNHRLKILNDINKHRKKDSIWSVPSSSSSVNSSTKPPFFPTPIDETDGNTSETRKIYRSSTLNHQNTVGIIGGVSVFSTLVFLEKLVWWSSRGGAESVPFIVCSEPMLTHEAKPTHSCCFHEDEEKGNDLSGSQSGRIVENLRHKRLVLEEGGAQCIVMPCHVSHGWHREISQGCKRPFLHVGECVARELKEARFKPLEAGSGVKIGVIANDATLLAGFYQDKLQNQGFEVVLPDKATMEHIVNPAIRSLKEKKDKEGARYLLRIAINILLVRAVNTVILASDELQCLLPHDDPLAKKCINPMDALARSAVRWAKSPKLNSKTTSDT